MSDTNHEPDSDKRKLMAEQIGVDLAAPSKDTTVIGLAGGFGTVQSMLVALDYAETERRLFAFQRRILDEINGRPKMPMVVLGPLSKGISKTPSQNLPPHYIVMPAPDLGFLEFNTFGGSFSPIRRYTATFDKTTPRERATDKRKGPKQRNKW